MRLSLSQELRQSRGIESEGKLWDYIIYIYNIISASAGGIEYCELFGLTGESKAGRKGKDFSVCVMHNFSGT